MVQVLREPTRRHALLDVLLVNKEGLMSKVDIGGHLGQSDHAVEFKISVDSRKSADKISTLDMRAEFRLLRELISKVPLENTFAGAEVHPKGAGIGNSKMSKVRRPA